MGRLIIFGLIVVVIIVGIVSSCAPVEITDVNSKVETAVSGNMRLIGQQQDVEVWSVVDNNTGTVCYITINKQVHLASSIFCINK